MWFTLNLPFKLDELEESDPSLRCGALKIPLLEFLLKKEKAFLERETIMIIKEGIRDSIS